MSTLDLSLRLNIFELDLASTHPIPLSVSEKLGGHLHRYEPTVLMHSPARQIIRFSSSEKHSSISMHWSPASLSFYPVEKC